MSFAGQHAQAHLATCNTSARRAEKGPLFGSSNRFSTATGDPTFILQPLLGRTPSEYHNGTPVRSPMNLHCIRFCKMLARNAARQVSASHQEIKSWSQNWIKNWIEIIKVRQHDSTPLATSTDHKALLLTKTQTSKYDSTSLQKMCPSLMGERLADVTQPHPARKRVSHPVADGLQSG